MNDKTEVKNTNATPKSDPTQPDWYLQWLVQIVNGREFEFPITLFVGGLMVSGNLTSGHKYFEGLGEQLTKFFGENAEETTKNVEYFTAPKKIYTEKNEDEGQPATQYIHLREARIFVPGQQPVPAEGSWWRGRLSNVDAFHFGSLSITKSN